MKANLKNALCIACISALFSTCSFAAPKVFTEKGETNMSAAFDGKKDTRWTSSTAIRSNMFITFDFGSEKTVGAMIFDLETSSGDFPNTFDVYAGESADTLEKVNAMSALSDKSAIVYFPKPITARMFKIQATSDKNPNWWSIHEAKFEEQPLENICAKVVTAKGTDSMALAFDDNVDSRWTTKEMMKNGMFVTIDLPAKRNTSKIIVNLGSSPNDFPNKFEIFTGDSADTATDKAEFDVARSANTITITFKEPVDAKAYKFVCLEGSPKYWWTFHEVSFE